MTEDFDSQKSELLDRINKLTFVIDINEKFFNEMQLQITKISKKPQVAQKCSTELNKIFEVLKNKQQMIESLKMEGNSELQIKSILFERDNLQMELEEAMNQIDQLESQLHGKESQ